MAEQSKPTRKTSGTVRATDTVVTGTGSSVATGRSVASTTDAQQRSNATATTTTTTTTATTAPTRPQPSPRNNVRVNVATLETAFLTGTPSRSVAYVQHALRERGFDPGSTAGVVDYATRAAYADYQRTLNERPTGLPTDGSLDHLGFDVVG